MVLFSHSSLKKGEPLFMFDRADDAGKPWMVYVVIVARLPLRVFCWACTLQNGRKKRVTRSGFIFRFSCGSLLNIRN
jgi:hypothetical protein